MRNVLLIMALVVASAALQAGCAATTRRGEPFGEPVVLDTPALELGEKVYMNHCQQCHPGGEAGLGLALNNKPLPEGLIKFQVRHGLGAMPGFGPEKISDEELAALASYVVALRHAPH